MKLLRLKNFSGDYESEDRRSKLINMGLGASAGVASGGGVGYIIKNSINNSVKKQKEDLDNKLIKKYILPIDPNDANKVSDGLKRLKKVKSRIISRIDKKAKSRKKIGKYASIAVGLGTGAEVYNRLKNRNNQGEL